MAKKKTPDKLDKIIEDLTQDATAAELLRDGGQILARALGKCDPAVRLSGADPQRDLHATVSLTRTSSEYFPDRENFRENRLKNP